jgi:hypothetical protein
MLIAGISFLCTFNVIARFPLQREILRSEIFDFMHFERARLPSELKHIIKRRNKKQQ